MFCAPVLSLVHYYIRLINNEVYNSEWYIDYLVVLHKRIVSLLNKKIDYDCS